MTAAALAVRLLELVVRDRLVDAVMDDEAAEKESLSAPQQTISQQTISEPAKLATNGQPRVDQRAAREAAEIAKLMAGGADVMEAMRRVAAAPMHERRATELDD
jgi:hypothetical protein